MMQGVDTTQRVYDKFEILQPLLVNLLPIRALVVRKITTSPKSEDFSLFYSRSVE